MKPSSQKFPHMFRIKFPTKRTFWSFPILRTNRMAPFRKVIYRTTQTDKCMEGKNKT